ncbi:hypothetical protein ACIBCM_18825 [Streptomyces sp. NPDC051018]|uniref:hypothetical protein n=1 Tax=Streptomyces sp. NPDC051018 TaxID=3365639 RepID=UPI003794DA32
MMYDQRAKQGGLPVTVHYEDGETSESLLVLDPAQLVLYADQVGHLRELSDASRKGKL